MTKETSLVPVGGLKLPKKVQDRLMEKMLDLNDTKIIDRIQQRNAHLEHITRLDEEIKALCTINVEQ